MRIAVTYEQGNVFQHFGRTEQFKIYEILDGKVAEAYGRLTEEVEQLGRKEKDRSRDYGAR